MAEHWCKEHKQAFFKKGKMKGFAHPILDDEGEPTGGWCNEPETTSTKASYKADPAKLDSIETQVAIKEIGECWRTGKLSDGCPLVLGYQVWLLATLSITAEETKKATPKPQPAQDESPLKNVGELLSRCYENGIDRQQAMNILGVTDIKDIGDLDQAWQIIIATMK